jgi:hypothetical protein
MAGQNPRRHPEAAFRTMGDEGGLVVLPTRREVKVLNPVGMRIFDLLDGELSESEIAQQVADEFQVGLEEAGGDVRLFLDDLRRAGMLIEEIAKEAPAGEVH